MSFTQKIKYGAISFFTGLAFVVFFVTVSTAFISGDSDDVGVRVLQNVEKQTEERPPAVVLTDPSRLEIPTLNIDAKIQKVGVNQKGNIASPTNFKDVGWYRYGPAPGAYGAALIDGHLNNGLGLAGVFQNLKNIKQGDLVSISDASGRKVTYKVTAIAVYGFENAPLENIFNAEPGARVLRLITCGGAWVKSEKTYAERLVATAELYSETSSAVR